MNNPTDKISLDFQEYCDRKNIERLSRSRNGNHDYAFQQDLQLRATLGSISILRTLAEAFTSSAASIRRHQALVEMAQATPRQFPKLFEIVRECSQRLDLPVPTLFVDSSPTVNAYTIATDDRAPFIVVSSGCVNHMDEDELRFVLGHECGHIHNQHGVYNYMAILAGNVALSQAMSLFSVMAGFVRLAQQGMRLGLSAWSRAGEITCDRAGAICVRDIRSPAKALAKLVAPVDIERFGPINPDEVVSQSQRASHSILRLEEAFLTHPLVGKRIVAIEKFLHSDVFAARRPELSGDWVPCSLKLVDEEVARMLATAHQI